MKDNLPFHKKIETLIKTNECTQTDFPDFDPQKTLLHTEDFIRKNFEFDFQMTDEARELFVKSLKSANFTVEMAARFERIMKALIRVTPRQATKADGSHVTEALHLMFGRKK